MDAVFRNYLVSRNQSLCGNMFAYSFPRNGPYVTVSQVEVRLYRDRVSGHHAQRDTSEVNTDTARDANMMRTSEVLFRRKKL
jgi:hypothetical protein